MFYSAITNGFYSTDIHGDNIPAGAVEIPDPYYKELLEGQSVGKMITNSGDYPVLVNPHVPTEEEALAVWRNTTEVTRFQARAALYQFGLLDAVETQMKSEDTPMLARIAWQDASVFKRMSPTVLSLAGLLALTDEQLDDLFKLAATLDA